jgi:hypothetical protein
MVVISSAELRSNIKKYLDLSAKETVVVQRKAKTFVLHAQECAPDADIVRAITKEELLTGIKSDIRKMYATWKQ